MNEKLKINLNKFNINIKMFIIEKKQISSNLVQARMQPKRFTGRGRACQFFRTYVYIIAAFKSFPLYMMGAFCL